MRVSTHAKLLLDEAVYVRVYMVRWSWMRSATSGWVFCTAFEAEDVAVCYQSLLALVLRL